SRGVLRARGNVPGHRAATRAVGGRLERTVHRGRSRHARPVGRVRGAGHRVVAVTNTNRTHEDYWRATFPDFDAAFDHIYSSAQLGARKPDAAFFETVLEQERVPPDQGFFIDDLAEN